MESHIVQIYELLGCINIVAYYDFFLKGGDIYVLVNIIVHMEFRWLCIYQSFNIMLYFYINLFKN